MTRNPRTWTRPAWLPTSQPWPFIPGMRDMDVEWPEFAPVEFCFGTANEYFHGPGAMLPSGETTTGSAR